MCILLFLGKNCSYTACFITREMQNRESEAWHGPLWTRTFISPLALYNNSESRILLLGQEWPTSVYSKAILYCKKMAQSQKYYFTPWLTRFHNKAALLNSKTLPVVSGTCVYIYMLYTFMPYICNIGVSFNLFYNLKSFSFCFWVSFGPLSFPNF